MCCQMDETVIVPFAGVDQDVNKKRVSYYEYPINVPNKKDGYEYHCPQWQYHIMVQYKCISIVEKQYDHI